MQNLLLLALHNCSAHMGRGGFVYCTASRQINSSPTQPSLIIAEQKMCVYSYPPARPGTLWTGIKAKGMGGFDGRKGEQKAGSSSLKMPNMTGRKPILLKKREGPMESPSKCQIQ